MVLVIANDFDPNAATASRGPARALERMGCTAIVRDTRLNRWGAAEAGAVSAEKQRDFEAAVVAKWAKLVDDYGADFVLSLDSHWLFSSQLFVQPGSRVRAVHSFWLDEIRMPDAPAFALDSRTLLNSEKVTHHCANDAQVEALRSLGIERVKRLGTGDDWEQRLDGVLA